MSLDNSDNLDIPDVDPLDPALEATTLPKFDMHLYKSSLNETHVKWLIKCYKILEELHPCVGNWFSFQSRVGKGCKPCFKDAPTSLKKWKDNFSWLTGGLRQSPCLGGITILAWRIPPKSGEFNESDVERLREGYKLAVGTLLPPGTAQVTHLTPPANRLEDIPLRTGDMVVAEMPCKKVLAEKEKKKNKVEVKAAAKADDSDRVKKVTRKKRTGEEGTSRKKEMKTRRETPTLNLDSKHNASAGRLDALRNQIDKQSPPFHENVDEHMANGGAGNEHGDENIVDDWWAIRAAHATEPCYPIRYKGQGP
ncbi:hypothetical protein Tco_0251842 [Tanacetum coccineum]